LRVTYIIFNLYIKFEMRVFIRSKDQTGTPETTRMWANAQPDGRPAEHRWRPVFNAAKSG